jgi:iron complex transport system substrate-binding protein
MSLYNFGSNIWAVLLYLGFFLVGLTGGEVKPGPAYESNQPGRPVLDMTGRPSFFPDTITKAVIMAPVAWDYITVDNTDKNVWAVSSFIREQSGRSFLGVIFPDFVNKKTTVTFFGNTPVGLEEMYLESPDALIVWDYLSGIYERVGYPGVARVTNYSFEGKDKHFDFFGRLIGKTMRADFLIKRGQAKMAAFLAEAQTTQKEVNFVVLTEGAASIFPNFPEFNRTVKLFQAKNLGENLIFIRGLNLETLIGLDPEVIFLYNDGFSSVSEIYGRPGFKSLRAVRQRKVYLMPSGVSRMEGPVERPILYNWIFCLLHPKNDGLCSLRPIIAETYWTVYGYRMSEDDLDQYLNIQENSLSRNYKKLFAR